MRIAVVGAQNVGKTTFVADFLLKFPEYISPKVSYKELVEKHGLKINQETGEGSQAVIMQALSDSIEKNSGENVIFDRCLVDNYVYSYCAYLKGKVSPEFIEASKEKMFEHLKFLEMIVFIPVSVAVEIQSDKQRDADRNFIDLVNRVFVEILLEISKRFSIKIVVLSGSREERVKEIFSKLSM